MSSPRITKVSCNACGEEFDLIDALESHECDGDAGAAEPLVADGGTRPEVIDAICAVVCEKLGPGEWGVYYAKQIARETEYSATEIGHYLGRAAGQNGRLDPIDLAGRGVDVSPWAPGEQTPRRWRIERTLQSGATVDDDRLVADGGFNSEESEFARRVSSEDGLQDLLTDIDVAMQNMWVDVRDEIGYSGEYHPATVEVTVSITSGGCETDGGEAVELDETFVSAPSTIHEYAPDPPELDPESMCTECGEAAYNYRCGSCARPLCRKHHELGAGFCSDFTRDEDDVPGCEIRGEFYRATHLQKDDEEIDRGEGIETDGGEDDPLADAAPGDSVTKHESKTIAASDYAPLGELAYDRDHDYDIADIELVESEYDHDPPNIKVTFERTTTKTLPMELHDDASSLPYRWRDSQPHRYDKPLLTEPARRALSLGIGVATSLGAGWLSVNTLTWSNVAINGRPLSPAPGLFPPFAALVILAALVVFAVPYLPGTVNGGAA